MNWLAGMLVFLGLSSPPPPPPPTFTMPEFVVMSRGDRCVMTRWQNLEALYEWPQRDLPNGTHECRVEDAGGE